LGWSECDGEFVIQATIAVAEHLILIDDEDGRAIPLDEAIFLGLQGGDDDWGVEVFGEVPGGDANLPTASAPLGEFIIGEGAGGNGVDGLAAIFALVRPKFEDQSFSGAGRGVHDDVFAFTQSGDGLLLPQVGNSDLVQSRQIGEW
jgi:hypothetical protein